MITTFHNDYFLTVQALIKKYQTVALSVFPKRFSLPVTDHGKCTTGSKKKLKVIRNEHRSLCQKEYGPKKRGGRVGERVGAEEANRPIRLIQHPR